MFVIHNTADNHLGRMTFVPDREDRPGTKVIHCGDVLLRHRKSVHVHVLVMYAAKNFLTRYSSVAKKFCYGRIFGTEPVPQ